MKNLSFKKWLMEVGSSGGVGGGIVPDDPKPDQLMRTDSIEKKPNAMPHYDNSTNPPVGWSKRKMMKSGNKSVKKKSESKKKK